VLEEVWQRMGGVLQKSSVGSHSWRLLKGGFCLGLEMGDDFRFYPISELTCIFDGKAFVERLLGPGGLEFGSSWSRDIPDLGMHDTFHDERRISTVAFLESILDT
jgi:hypothetical protein